MNWIVVEPAAHPRYGTGRGKLIMRSKRSELMTSLVNFSRADVAQPHGRIALLDGVTDGVHQVRFCPCPRRP